MYTIVGFKFLNFKDDSGNLVTGYKLHLLSNQDDTELDEGRLAFNKFFSARSIRGKVEIGATCDLKFALSGNTPKLIGLVINND